MFLFILKYKYLININFADLSMFIKLFIHRGTNLAHLHFHDS